MVPFVLPGLDYLWRSDLQIQLYVDTSPAHFLGIADFLSCLQELFLPLFPVMAQIQAVFAYQLYC